MSDTPVSLDQPQGVRIDQSMTFETALARLEEIVARLENQDAPLDESVRLYQEGIALRSLCQKRLDAARMTIEHITPPSGDDPPDSPHE